MDAELIDCTYFSVTRILPSCNEGQQADHANFTQRMLGQHVSTVWYLVTRWRDALVLFLTDFWSFHRFTLIFREFSVLRYQPHLSIMVWLGQAKKGKKWSKNMTITASSDIWYHHNQPQKRQLNSFIGSRSVFSLSTTFRIDIVGSHRWMTLLFSEGHPPS